MIEASELTEFPWKLLLDIGCLNARDSSHTSGP